jgi:hypothetical protein
MSWTDLFKSKSKASARSDPRLRWFGKLPTYPDYYRSQTDEEWAVEFNDWVLRGYEMYRSRLRPGDHEHIQLPESGCVIRLPKSGMTVFASVLDYGGDMRGRAFPMFFYIGAPTTLIPGPTSDRLAATSHILPDLLSLRRDVTRFLNSPGSFEAALGDREVDLGDIDEQVRDSSWITTAKTVSMDDWFAAAKNGLKVKDQHRWLALASEWGDNIAKHEGKNFEPTLQFPLASGVPLKVQTAGWFRWLESRMDLERREMSLIVTGDVEKETGRLTLIAREVVPDDFLLLTSLSNTLPYLDNLSEVGSSYPDADDEGPVEPADLPPEESGSWADFVLAQGPAT